MITASIDEQHRLQMKDVVIETNWTFGLLMLKTLFIQGLDLFAVLVADC